MNDLKDSIETKIFIPRTDIGHFEDKYVIWADMPGVAPAELDINVKEETLFIKAKVKNELEEGLKSLRTEYPTGDWEVSFQISNKVDVKNIEAEIKEGVLTINMPVLESVKPRQIKVRAA
jgi:HSP20 family protein